jgi:hypothetical protein
LGDDFKLLLPDARGRPTSEMKAAKDRDENITKTIRECINQDRAGHGDGSSRFSAYMNMCRALQGDGQTTRNATTPAARSEARKSSRKSKTSLRHFTKGTRKSKKGSDDIKGWSVQGKLYMESMVKRIKSEVPRPWRSHPPSAIKHTQ